MNTHTLQPIHTQKGEHTTQQTSSEKGDQRWFTLHTHEKKKQRARLHIFTIKNTQHRSPLHYSRNIYIIITRRCNCCCCCGCCSKGEGGGRHGKENTEYSQHIPNDGSSTTTTTTAYWFSPKCGNALVARIHRHAYYFQHTKKRNTTIYAALCVDTTSEKRNN